jgi:diguanylate cyclase (GGDEF)-like protein/PAS domain S-box-containing protein
MKTSQRFDSISILLSLFMVLIISLFYYLYSVEKNIQNYTSNHNNIVTLELLDKQLDNFSISMNAFSNYDKINQSVAKFKKTFAILQENLLLQHPKNGLIKKRLQTINKDFERKIENIEYFKSLNASLISGSHFLFDLQRTIAEDSHISAESKSLINETLFYMLRYTSSSYIDKAYVEKKLQELKREVFKTKQQFIANFYKQSVVMLNTIAALKNTTKNIHNSQLYASIKNVHTLLDTIYERNIFIQKFITMLFFLSTIVILLTLIITHIRSLKNEKELYAFKYAVQHSDNSIIITDPQRHINYVNEVFEKTTGYSKEEVLDKNPNILKSDRQNDTFYKELNTKLDKGEKWEGEFINKRKDGSLYYEKASIVPVFLNKKLISYLAIKLDITKYVEQNMKLAQAASVFENTEEAIIIADNTGKITSINSAFTSIYGYTIEDIEGENLNILHSGLQDKNFYQNMWNQIIEEGLWRGKIINKTKSGENIPVWSTIKKITDKFGKTVNYSAIQTNLREIENSQAKADYLAYHDSLTGLYNRVNFEEYLAHALFMAKRSNKLLAILFIDLDRFKIINDTLGHDIGDQVLITVASRLKTTLRDSDFISRWGGDEFVVILQNINTTSDTAVVATNIVDALKEPIEIGDHHLITTASIGISLYPENGEDANTLIKHADSAMYLAKDMGKNNFCYYTSELSKQIQNKLNIDMALHNALEKNELYMVFQPQYNLSNKQVISVESLVRWKNSELGFVPPDEFIPIAEDSGTIVSLGYFIFEESCKGYKQMKDNGVPLERIAINVSSIQFKEAHLLETFISIAQRHNIATDEIEIEITERFLMEHTVANITLLQSFRNYGFKISIDDFGTGYSSMSYLKQLPVDTIKIDKSFVDDIAEGSSDNIVIEAIIALSKTLGYLIIAEGIETEEQENFLADVHCDIGQGYLFSKPVSCDEIITRFSS